jgi:hypothetical protein
VNKPHIAIMHCGRWGVWTRRTRREYGGWPVARGPDKQSAFELAALVQAENGGAQVPAHTKGEM